MSTHKRNWMLIWTAVGALAVAVPVGLNYTRSIILGDMPAKVETIEHELHEVKGDVKLIMMHNGIADVSHTNHLAGQ